jgi:hypothetical protein
MRKVVVSEYVTVDGVFEDLDRWHFDFWHDEIAKYKSDELAGKRWTPDGAGDIRGLRLHLARHDRRGGIRRTNMAATPSVRCRLP